MALSNIRVEPKREIIESALGILALLIILPVWVLSAIWFQQLTGGPGRGCPWILGLVLVPLSLLGTFLLGVVFLYLTHFMGEKTSDLLAKVGWDPRPKQRYKLSKVYNRSTDTYETIRVAV